MKLLLFSLLAGLLLGQAACVNKGLNTNAPKEENVPAIQKELEYNTNGKLYTDYEHDSLYNVDLNYGNGLYALRPFDVRSASGAHELLWADLRDAYNYFYSGLKEGGVNIYFSTERTSRFKIHYLGVDGTYYTLDSAAAKNKPLANFDEANSNQIYVKWEFDNFNVELVGFIDHEYMFHQELYFVDKRGRYSQMGSASHKLCQVTNDNLFGVDYSARCNN